MNPTLTPPVQDAGSAPPVSDRGTPTWEIAYLYPPQGAWTEAEYLRLETNRLVELKDGCLEFPDMPKIWHQWVLQELFVRLRTWVETHQAGLVLFAPVWVRLRPGLIREPDLAYWKPGRIIDPEAPAPPADLVMEIVSEGPDHRKRDLETKREEYAAAGIPEYWLVDLSTRQVTILTLAGTAYAVHGVFSGGQMATSRLLSGFTVHVTELFRPLPAGPELHSGQART